MKTILTFKKSLSKKRREQTYYACMSLLSGMNWIKHRNGITIFHEKEDSKPVWFFLIMSAFKDIK